MKAYKITATAEESERLERLRKAVPTLNKITLRLEGRNWTATFSGPEAAKTVELFGTATLPTSFMVGTPGAIVAEKIRELNPGWEVELALRPIRFSSR